MKFTVSKKDILPVIEVISNIINSAHQLPVLQCILFLVEKSKLILRGTNIDISVESDIQIQNAKEGKTAIPARILLQTIQAIKDENIQFEMKENSVSISSKHGKSSIRVLPTEDFPIVSEKEIKKGVIINAKSFCNGLKSVLFSSSKSVIKPELSGVFVYKDGPDMVFVASDSFRLAERKLSIESENFQDIIIPANTASFLCKIGEVFNGDIELSIEETQASAKIANTEVSFRVVDGTFPDYKVIIPKQFETEAVLLTSDLLLSLRKSALFSDSFSQIGFHIYPERKTFSITSQNASVGEDSEECEAALSGSDIDITFNHKYILDCVQNVQSDSISLSFAGEGKPLIIRPADDSNVTYLVMPMNR